MMDDIRSITCRCERSLLSSPLFLPLSSLLSARAHLTLVSQRRGETDRSRRTGTETMEGKRDERGLDSHRRCTHSPLLSSHPHDSANHLTQHVSLVHHPSTPCISCPLLSSPSPLFSISTSDPRSLFPHPPFDSLRHQQWPGTEAKMNPPGQFGEKSYIGSDKLKGQAAIVTGGDSGIGRAVAIAYAREGCCDVCISYLPQEQADAEECKKMIELRVGLKGEQAAAAGREEEEEAKQPSEEKSRERCILVPGDLCDEKYPAQLVAACMKEFGRVDILVNNAAYQGESVSSITDISLSRIERTFRTNIISMFELTKSALPHMKAGGSIICTSSIQSYHPSAHILDYACTKGAITAFVKGLAQELMEKGIRVNCVAVRRIQLTRAGVRAMMMIRRKPV